jgi:hypothetical protein
VIELRFPPGPVPPLPRAPEGAPTGGRY